MARIVVPAVAAEALKVDSERMVFGRTSAGSGTRSRPLEAAVENRAPRVSLHRSRWGLTGTPLQQAKAAVVVVVDRAAAGLWPKDRQRMRLVVAVDTLETVEEERAVRGERARRTSWMSKTWRRPRDTWAVAVEQVVQADTPKRWFRFRV